MSCPSENVGVSRENVVVSRPLGSVSKHEECVKPASVTLGKYECVHMRVNCGLCDGSVRRKSCIGTATEKSSLYKSAEGDPQSKRGGGEAKKVAELSEGTRNLKREGKFKLVPGSSPPIFSPLKKSSKSNDKNPYMGSRGTPTKRKLVQNQTVKTLISLFNTQGEPELPGDVFKLESPAKRRRRTESKLNDHPD